MQRNFNEFITFIGSKLMDFFSSNHVYKNALCHKNRLIKFADSLIDLATESGSQIFRAVAYSSSLVDAYTEMVTNRQNITSRMVQGSVVLYQLRTT